MSLDDTQHQRLALLTALNGAIAAAKLWVATLTGSSVVLAEAVRSLADLSSQALTSIGLPRAQTRPSHGEIAFWSAAVGILLYSFAAGIAVYEGVDRIVRPRPLTEPATAYALLVGGSVLQAAQMAFATLYATRRHEPLSNCERIRTGVGLLSAMAALAGFLAANMGEIPGADGYGAIVVGLCLAVIAAMMALETRGALASVVVSWRSTTVSEAILPAPPTGTPPGPPPATHMPDPAPRNDADGERAKTPRKRKGKRRRR